MMSLSQPIFTACQFFLRKCNKQDNRLVLRNISFIFSKP